MERKIIDTKNNNNSRNNINSNFEYLWKDLVAIRQLISEVRTKAKSNYELWLESGYKGTLDDFLRWQKGKDGSNPLPQEVAPYLQPYVITQVKAEYDKLNANKQQDGEVITARSGETSLNTRLNKMNNNEKGVSVLNFGAVGDGIIDDTAALQKAFDYSAANRIPVINTNAKKVFNISKPLYYDRYAQIDLGGATIKKTSNAVGTGSNTYYNGSKTDSYAVDAFLIGRHLDNWVTTDTSISNIIFKRSASNIVEYGIYAPRNQMCEFENIWSDYFTTNYCLYGFLFTMIPKIHNIKQYNGKVTFKIPDDGTNFGGSTAIIASHIVGYDQDGCISWYGAPYSVINNAMIDKSHNRAYEFASSPGIVINSPSIEHNDGTLFHISDSKVVVNSARVLYNKGVAGVRTLNYVGQKSYFTMNNSEIQNYEGTFVAAEQMNMTIADDSHVVLVNTLMPSNGNSYGSYTGGSTLNIIDKDGITYYDSSGNGTKVKGLRKINGTAAPTTGIWKTNEEINNVNKTNGIDKWVCTVGGTPGTWQEVRLDGEKRKHGTAYFTGDGISKTFSLTHNYGSLPKGLMVTPNNPAAGAASIDYATVNDTQITVVFKNPISSGSQAAVKWFLED